MSNKVVLAYSGGLDTSCAIRWLQDQGYEVVTLTLNVGQPDDFRAIEQKAWCLGAVQVYVRDAQDEFAREFIVPAIQANALYEGVYPLISSLSRPLIARHLVDVARREGAQAVAHGCTGKGNDQVRFELSVAALAPDLRVIAPVRTWGMSRTALIDYARARGIPVPVTHDAPYSIDENLWGRSIEAGVLEDPMVEPPEEVFTWTTAPTAAPDEPQTVRVQFERGTPVALNETPMELVPLIRTLNAWAGRHGIGRIDHIESRFVGIKSREVYEAPAAAVLLTAHRALESVVLPRSLLHFKQMMDQTFADLVYNGFWFTPLREAVTAFVEKTQDHVTGTVHLRLWKGHVQVVGLESPHSLYRLDLATYGATDAFDHRAAEGFIHILSLDIRAYAQARKASVLSTSTQGEKT